jgi:hypothetical protein
MSPPTCLPKQGGLVMWPHAATKWVLVFIPMLQHFTGAEEWTYPDGTF